MLAEDRLGIKPLFRDRNWKKEERKIQRKSKSPFWRKKISVSEKNLRF